MFEMLLMIVSFSPTGPQIPTDSSLPFRGDTVAVLTTAFEHHFAEERLDSVAINVEGDPGKSGFVPEEVLLQVATELQLPVAIRG